MEIDIVIPTLHRAEKLKQCVDSIYRANKHLPPNFITVYIYFSDREDFLHSTISMALTYPDLNIIPRFLLIKYDAANFWNTHIKSSESSTVMYLNDDIILDEFCIKNAYNCMVENFDDSDGVVGLYQQNLPENQTVKTAFGMIGRKFSNRFPERKVFCEDYKRFYLDKELEEYSEDIGKLVFCKDSKLTHLHPAFDKSQEDSTHDNVRKYLNKDKMMYLKRKSINYLWGKNFNTLSMEEVYE